MKKSVIILLFLIFGVQALANSAPAFAMIYKYNPGKPAVEVDPGVLLEDTVQVQLNISRFTQQAAPSADNKKLSKPFFTSSDVQHESPKSQPIAELENAAPAPTPEKKDEPKTAVPTTSDLMLAFETTSSIISPDGQKKLDNLAQQMKDNPDLRVQIRGYASGEDGNASNAKRMSLSRGLMVRTYLIDKEIKPVRLDIRALGSKTDRTPVDRVDLVFVR